MRRMGYSFVLFGVPLVIGCAARRGGGEDLAGRVLIERQYAAPHAAVFAAAARALVDEGYAIRLRDSSEREGVLVTHPRHTWIDCLETSAQATATHPGIEAAIMTERRGDSTAFRVTAHTLTRTQMVGRNGERVDVSLPLEVCTMTALAARVDSILSPERRAAPARVPASAMVMPRKLGDFALVDTQHFPTPGAGTGYRYTGLKGLRPDVYVYPGHLESYGTDTAAALASAVGDFLQALPLGRARGQYSDFKVRENAPARRDLSGTSLLVHRVLVEKRVGNRVLDDYFHIAVVGNNYIKVRTTFDRGAATEADVESFVGQLLETLLRNED